MKNKLVINKKNIRVKDLIILLVLSFSSVTIVHSQNTFSFAYDASGNRVARQVIELKILKQPNAKDSATSALPVTEIKDKLGDQDVSIFPNPTTGKITVQFQGTSAEGASVSIYDMNGRLIQAHNNLSGGAAEMDLSNSANGIYVLRIFSGGKKGEWKIIKE